MKKKVAVIIINNTASAAESLLLALKNNPNVKVFGTSSAGFTSVNSSRIFINKNSDNFWWLVYTIGYYELIKPIKGQYVFNNEPIPPDCYVDLHTMDRSSQDITQYFNKEDLFNSIIIWFDTNNKY